MKTPSIISDNGISNGGWGTVQPYTIEYDFPFSDRGDNNTFVARQKYKIDKLNYRPRPAMTLNYFSLGAAYLIKCGSPRDAGCGLYDVEDTFGCVPARRTEYGSFNFTQQWYDVVGNTNVDPTKYFYNVSYDLTEQSFTVSASFLYEYFVNSVPQPLIRARAFFVFSRLFFIGGSPPTSGSAVAEDSSISIYGGTIFCRRTPYVNINPGTASSVSSPGGYTSITGVNIGTPGGLANFLNNTTIPGF